MWKRCCCGAPRGDGSMRIFYHRVSRANFFECYAWYFFIVETGLWFCSVFDFQLIPGASITLDGESPLNDVRKNHRQDSAPGINIFVLNVIRFLASLLYCFRPRVVSYAVKRFVACKIRLSFFLRICGYVFNKDLWKIKKILSLFTAGYKILFEQVFQ